MTTLETARLLLRPIETADFPALYTLFSDPEVMRFGDGPQTETWVREWIAWVRWGYGERGYGPLAVVEKRGVSVIGYCGLFYFAVINGAPEIELGYRLIRAAWGMGYATEAGTAVRDYAFQSLGLKRLISLIDPANTASIAVAQKLGMTCEGEVML
ncbi:MAG: GNAT family N-acetyltransferase, partial [Candidatus Promineifilaceae bacterium]